MIRRLLLLLVAALVASWWLKRLTRSLSAPARRESGGARPIDDAPREAMVRDRVCNTFLPRSRALTHREDGQEHYFCSEQCRRSHLEIAAEHRREAGV